MAAGHRVKRAPMPSPGGTDHSGLASARVRERMVERVRELGVRDARVLEAMRAVPRHLFVDEALASRAYEDTALPIGHGQTISQPYIVARIAELALEGIAEPRAARLLEIGTGCGSLQDQCRERRLAASNITLEHATKDGYLTRGRFPR